jgi:hypothetical protein
MIFQSQTGRFDIENEPPLMILLQYARAANVSTDVLIDDELDLTAKLPARRK